MKDTKRLSIWAIVLLLTCNLALPTYAKGKKKNKDNNATTTSADTSTDASKKAEKKADKAEDKSASASAKVDINNATQKELEELPGVGAATAKKIIQNRPYADASELSKAGISQSTVSKITPLVTAGTARASSRKSKKDADNSNASTGSGSSASTSSSTSEPTTTTTKGKSSSSNTSSSSSSADRGTPGNGNVWVNLDTGVYHKEGARWYGKTKNGKYMSEQDAIKAGYRASKR